ncbi:VCBS repeat-containing protein [Pricia sp.]|uniref:VCBS repeat-containing protein n=1 Tax=Pricia sp. TaxID=2268138 RepID=UPI003593669F
MRSILFVLASLSILLSCQKEKTDQKQFSLLDPAETGILFSNDIQETDSLNYFTYPYMYMGGGISAGDLNNDGLIDLFFTANMRPNKLYLNRGDLMFEDITEKAQVSGDERWYTGTTMVDINNDSFLDIYVSVSGKGDDRRNLLYINNGDLRFTESAKAYGLDDDGHTTQSTFFDYDNDGDLDLYVANYPIAKFSSPVEFYGHKVKNPTLDESDILYKNNGNGTFTDVTQEAGILNYGLSLSATVGDLNNDGWKDVYVSNDFDSPDYMYLNNQDGTFNEVSQSVVRHTSQYGMGADIADYNNDGLLDIGQVDMTPEDNRRLKANMASMNPLLFTKMIDYDLGHQYMQNSLQLNRGLDPDGNLNFSEVSRMAGIATTDWSWSILFSDLDNDGLKDIFISNGTRRDINNRDYFKKLSSKLRFNKTISGDEVQNIPSEKIANYVFRNQGDLTFKNNVEAWGLDEKTFSNGAVYADLDNDGDQDLVINNIDQTATVYRNNNPADHNYLKIRLNGASENKNGLGAKVYVSTKVGEQMQELTLTRGFQSSMAPELHFGLGNQEAVANLKVVWPNGKISTEKNIPSNQTIDIDYETAAVTAVETKGKKKWFQTINNDSLSVAFMHKENQYDDYLLQPLLPHQTSKLGPGIAVADVNSDGLDDFYIGGAAKQAGVLFMQNSEGKFSKSNTSVWERDKNSEDMSALFFDCDNDGDQDLYVVSGGNEFKPDSPELQDRLYLNDGKGNFKKAPDRLPKMLSSGSRTVAADYDNDGDLDLFVGGRLVPGQYPWPNSSYILKNNKGVFEDVTETVAPDFKDLGMVTDAIWTDFNGDSTLDLVLVGEWMPISFYANENDTFKNVTTDTGLDNTNGWWFSLAQDDFDNDGDMDFVAGNLGLNYKYQATPEEPFEVFADDFDNNNRKDIVLSYYNFGELFPVRGRSCSSQQMPSISVKFENYESFAVADVKEVYGKEELEDAEIHYQAKTFASSYIENLGHGKFKITALPNEAQFSSVNQIVSGDIDGDGFKDLVIAGNLYASEIETTRNDSSIGLYLKGDGKGDFTPVDSNESGLYIPGDVKDISILTIHNQKYIAAAKSGADIQFVKIGKKH